MFLELFLCYDSVVNSFGMQSTSLASSTVYRVALPVPTLSLDSSQLSTYASNAVAIRAWATLQVDSTANQLGTHGACFGMLFYVVRYCYGLINPCIVVTLKHRFPLDYQPSPSSATNVIDNRISDIASASPGTSHNLHRYPSW